MPLAACALRSGGQEERKRSSSFIMERMLEADTSASERSNARLESWAGETVNVSSKYTPESAAISPLISLESTVLN